MVVERVVDRCYNDGPVCDYTSMDPVFYTVDVEHVWKGEPDGSVVVWSPINGASCGVEWEQGARYLVTLQDDGQDPPEVHLCQIGARSWSHVMKFVGLLGEPAETRVDFPPPDYRILAAHLFSSNRQLRDIAIDFWSASSCGRNYLYRVIDRLPLTDEEELAVLREIMATVDRPGATEQANAELQRPRRWNRSHAYECSPEEQAWVDTQLGR